MNIKSAFIPETRVQVYFLQDDDYFKPITQLLYKAKNGRVLNDNDVRFGLFAKVALDTLKKLYWKPDVIICNDWQMSFVPQLLKENCCAVVLIDCAQRTMDDKRLDEQSYVMRLTRPLLKSIVRQRWISKILFTTRVLI